jgi:rod shape-determining protein MreB
MVVDIGGGTTEVGVFCLGGIVVSRSLRIAGDEMDQDIIQYARQKYNLFIGEWMAERTKIAVGSAYPLSDEMTMTIRGRNLVTGLPEQIEISSIEIREALGPSLDIILDAIRDTLDETPPELVSDLMETGICMAGGTSQLKGLAERVSDEVNITAWVAEDSMTCVARGAGKVLEELDTLREVLVSADDRRPAMFGRW